MTRITYFVHYIRHKYTVAIAGVVAEIYTRYIDLLTGIAYKNTDGGTTWVEDGGGGDVVGFDWNATEGTFDITTQINSAVVKTSHDTVKTFYNNYGAIAKGVPVRISAYNSGSDRFEISPATADTFNNSKVIGVTLTSSVQTDKVVVQMWRYRYY